MLSGGFTKSKRHQTFIFVSVTVLINPELVSQHQHNPVVFSVLKEAAGDFWIDRWWSRVSPPVAPEGKLAQ